MNQYRQKARIVIQKLIDRHREELGFGQEARSFADLYIETVFSKRPTAFESESDERADLDCIAALSMANAVRIMPRSDPDWFEVVVMLEGLLADIDAADEKRKFSDVDLEFVQEARVAFTNAIEWKDSKGVSLLDMCKQTDDESS